MTRIAPFLHDEFQDGDGATADGPRVHALILAFLRETAPHCGRPPSAALARACPSGHAGAGDPCRWIEYVGSRHRWYCAARQRTP